MQELGISLVLAGLLLLVLGIGLWMGWCGRLPGDIFTQKVNGIFLFPDRNLSDDQPGLEPTDRVLETIKTV